MKERIGRLARNACTASAGDGCWPVYEPSLGGQWLLNDEVRASAMGFARPCRAMPGNSPGLGGIRQRWLGESITPFVGDEGSPR